MIRFNAEDIFNAFRMLAIADTLVDKEKRPEYTERFQKIIKESCEKIEKQSDLLGLPLSKISAMALRNYVAAEKKADDVVNFRINELGNRLQDEMKVRAVFCISPDKSNYLIQDDRPPWGEKVVAAFPSGAYDIAEAGNSYALARNTACVFHCMRVMEIGINSLAKGLGVAQPIEHDRTWGKVLKKISNQMENLPKSPEWTARTPYIENSYAFMRAAKNAWRDDTMHIGPKYDEQDAGRIMRATENFIQDLSELVDENGKFLYPS